MNDKTTTQPTIPADVAQTLSYLANLIDAGLNVRSTNENPRSFAARHLKVPVTEVVAEERSAGHYEFFAVGRAGVEFMAESMIFGTMGHNSTLPPTWDAIHTDEATIRYPVSLYAAVSHPDWESPIVLGYMRSYQARSVFVLHRSIDERLGSRILDHLWQRSSRVDNPFKGAVLSATAGRGREFDFKLTIHRPLERSSVFLPSRVWDELDVNVSSLINHYEELAERGLAATRGVLLHGPPGTGKTAAIRAIVTEHQSRATVIMCDSGAVTEAASEMMVLAADLAPTIVVIEDIDRLISDRNHGFLAALDGVEIDRTGVVVLATANNVSEMGSAALRSARFDVKIEVPLPDPRTRRAILNHYLSENIDDDLGRVVTATEGASGADLREVVSAATLEARGAGRPVTAARLADLARARFTRESEGFYL